MPACECSGLTFFSRDSPFGHFLCAVIETGPLSVNRNALTRVTLIRFPISGNLRVIRSAYVPVQLHAKVVGAFEKVGGCHRTPSSKSAACPAPLSEAISAPSSVDGTLSFAASSTESPTQAARGRAFGFAKTCLSVYVRAAIKVRGLETRRSDLARKCETHAPDSVLRSRNRRAGRGELLMGCRRMTGAGGRGQKRESADGRENPRYSHNTSERPMIAVGTRGLRHDHVNLTPSAARCGLQLELPRREIAERPPRGDRGKGAKPLRGTMPRYEPSTTGVYEYHRTRRDRRFWRIRVLLAHR